MVTLKLINKNGTFDVTDRVIEIGELHEKIGDESGFEIPTVGFDLDNNDNWLTTYNSTIKDATTYVEIKDLDAKKVVFYGRLNNVTPVNNIKDRFLHFESDHVIAKLQDQKFELPEPVRAGTNKSGRPILQWILPLNLDKQNESIEIANIHKTIAINDTFLYVQQAGPISEQIEKLTLFGDILRALGAVWRWKDNRFHFTDRLTMLDNNQTATDVSDLLLDFEYVNVWQDARPGVQMTSGNNRITLGRGVKAQELDTPEKRKLPVKNFISLDTDIIANIHERNKYKKSLIDQIFENIAIQYYAFYVRFPEEIKVVFSGLDLWAGWQITFNGKRYLIYETYKNFKDLTTTAYIIDNYYQIPGFDIVKRPK